MELNNVPEIVFPFIQKLFTDLQIEYQPIFINDPLDFNKYVDLPSNIYFTYYKHVVEKRTETETDAEEIIEYNNWYIVMYNEKLLFSKPFSNDKVIDNNMITDNTTQINTTQETQINTTQETQINTTQETQINTTQETQINTTQDNITQETIQDNTKYQLLQEYNTVKESNIKITIKILKEFLQRVDLKVSGKREELQQRLETYLTV
jgi:hypothetical protein